MSERVCSEVYMWMVEFSNIQYPTVSSCVVAKDVAAQFNVSVATSRVYCPTPSSIGCVVSEGGISNCDVTININCSPVASIPIGCVVCEGGVTNYDVTINN